MKTLTSAALSTLLILFSGCAGTTDADRMPHAVDGITSVLDSVNKDLEATKKELDAETLADSVRAMLGIEYADLKQRVAMVRGHLRKAAADVDSRALETAARKIEILNHLVSAFRGTPVIAEAAASGKRPWSGRPGQGSLLQLPPAPGTLPPQNPGRAR
jgi:outer membrane murein-binding lipoprotein Lpp